ncbi:hypothetical protein BB561_002370 [Smittium simulii]|uniref:Sugar phosphate transporter domain-containing protein n=1 Tax=Smittium simulii TaxID=133385 RepID=A0A2T9YQS0_9FUNG|nr:hypothetical protein BB561_002370 [Smittium simulii]
MTSTIVNIVDSKYETLIQDSKFEKSILFEQLDRSSRKAVLTAYPYPVTLSLIQFLSLFAFLFVYAICNPKNLSLYVNLRDLSQVALISVNQVVGHIINSSAISFAPISLVYTIKGISPLFTIIICKLAFGTKYTKQIYLSLFPLITGIVLTSFKASGLPAIGFILSVLSSITIAIGGVINKVVVSKTQNSMKSQNNAHLVKYKVLFHTCITSTIIIFPIWLLYEAPMLFYARKSIVSDLQKRATVSTINAQYNSRDNMILMKLLLHCISHAAQAFFSISLISATSPVTFSICSLMKRVVVILFALLWAQQPITHIQFLGILIFFVGLFMYSFSKKK